MQLIKSNDNFSIVEIVRQPLDDYLPGLHYAKLLPSGNHYCLKIKPKIWNNSLYREIRIYQNEVEKYVNRDYGASTEEEIVIDNLNIKDGTTFSLKRSGNIEWINITSKVKFIVKTDASVFLLKLNKLLRLSKATELSPTEIERIILVHNTEMNVDNSVITSLFNAVRYKQRYNLSTEEALILCGATISQKNIGETVSQFDKLFNQVPSNENTLATDYNLKINLNPDNKDNKDWKKAIKQAFQVNDDELRSIAGNETFTPSLSNLSRLYFIHLLGRLHGLTVNQTE